MLQLVVDTAQPSGGLSSALPHNHQGKSSADTSLSSRAGHLLCSPHCVSGRTRVRSRGQSDDGPARTSVAKPATEKRGPQRQTLPHEAGMTSSEYQQLEELPLLTALINRMASSTKAQELLAQERPASWPDVSRPARACFMTHGLTLVRAGPSHHAGHMPRSFPVEVEPASQQSGYWMLPVAVQRLWLPLRAVNHPPELLSKSSVHPSAEPCFPGPMGSQRLGLVPASRSVPSPQSADAIASSVLIPSICSIVSPLFSLSCCTLCGSTGNPRH